MSKRDHCYQFITQTKNHNSYWCTRINLKTSINHKVYYWAPIYIWQIPRRRIPQNFSLILQNKKRIPMNSVEITWTANGIYHTYTVACSLQHSTQTCKYEKNVKLDLNDDDDDYVCDIFDAIARKMYFHLNHYQAHNNMKRDTYSSKTHPHIIKFYHFYEWGGYVSDFVFSKIED